MAYITNKEREKTIKKINKGNGGRKIFVIMNLFLWLAFVTIFVVCAFLYEKASAGGVADNQYWYLSWNNIIHDNGDGTSTWLMPEGSQISLYGLLMVIFLCVLVASNIISTIIIISFESARKVTGKVNKLASSALSGKRRTSSSSADVKDRIGR